VQVRRARWWTLIYGVLVTLLAFVISQFRTNLVESINTIMGVIGGPMLGLFLLGMFTKKADQRGAITGCIVGLVGSLFLMLYKVSPGEGRPPAPIVSFLWLTMFSAIVTMIVGHFTSSRSARPSVPHQ
jgi:Na+/proline symporter